MITCSCAYAFAADATLISSQDDGTDLISYPQYEAAKKAADALHQLGLFEGTGVDEQGNPVYNLESNLTRSEAAALLTALLARSDYARSRAYTAPFEDVADWAKPYVNFCYEMEYTSGTSSTKYSGEAPVTATQYITFVLRALGYENKTDFNWDKAWVLSDKLKITSGDYNASTNEDFTRGDAAIISYAALSQKLKGSSVTPSLKLLA